MRRSLEATRRDRSTRARQSATRLRTHRVGVDATADTGSAEAGADRDASTDLVDMGGSENDRPFIVLSPQHSGGGSPSANEMHNLTAYASVDYDVDVQRLYLTGLSCGAIGGGSRYLRVDADPHE